MDLLSPSTRFIDMPFKRSEQLEAEDRLRASNDHFSSNFSSIIGERSDMPPFVENPKDKSRMLDPGNVMAEANSAHARRNSEVSELSMGMIIDPNKPKPNIGSDFSELGQDFNDKSDIADKEFDAALEGAKRKNTPIPDFIQGIFDSGLSLDAEQEQKLRNQLNLQEGIIWEDELKAGKRGHTL